MLHLHIHRLLFDTEISLNFTTLLHLVHTRPTPIPFYIIHSLDRCRVPPSSGTFLSTCLSWVQCVTKHLPLHIDNVSFALGVTLATAQVHVRHPDVTQLIRGLPPEGQSRCPSSTRSAQEVLQLSNVAVHALQHRVGSATACTLWDVSVHLAASFGIHDFTRLAAVYSLLLIPEGGEENMAMLMRSLLQLLKVGGPAAVLTVVVHIVGMATDKSPSSVFQNCHLSRGEQDVRGNVVESRFHELSPVVQKVLQSLMRKDESQSS
eukprot:PhF_6_TR41987/c0_g1_i1/m.63505